MANNKIKMKIIKKKNKMMMRKIQQKKNKN